MFHYEANLPFIVTDVCRCLPALCLRGALCSTYEMILSLLPPHTDQHSHNILEKIMESILRTFWDTNWPPERPTPTRAGAGASQLFCFSPGFLLRAGEGSLAHHPESCQSPAQLSLWSLEFYQSLNGRGGCTRAARRHLAVTARGDRDPPMAWSLLPLPGTAVAKVLRAGTLSPWAGSASSQGHSQAAPKRLFSPHAFSRHLPRAKLGFLLTMAMLRARGAAVFVWLWKPKCSAFPRAEAGHSRASPARGTNPASSLGLPLLCPHARLDMAHAKTRQCWPAAPASQQLFAKRWKKKDERMILLSSFARRHQTEAGGVSVRC